MTSSSSFAPQQSTNKFVLCVRFVVSSPQALELCGERREAGISIFPAITSGEHINHTIATWVKRAGIAKHITF
ncbi:MAG: hypothetical protein LBV26_01780, partial [Bacteroidales bacterium]|nr:hypothetical protein [Bacteroidales bacterium]